MAAQWSGGAGARRRRALFIGRATTGGDGGMTRAEMPPCYGAPQSARVQPGSERTGGPSHARRTYDAAVGRRVARGSRGISGAATAWGRRATWDGGLPQPVVASGADAEGGRGAGATRGAAALRPTP
jgi:hypothetical protein